MDVEQRHDIKAAVIGRQRQSSDCIMGRGADIALAERYHLGPRGGTRSMKYQCFVVRLGIECGCGRDCRAAKCEDSGCLVQAGNQLDNRDSELRCYLSRRGVHTGLNQQGLGLEIGKIKFEFRRLISWVERRSSSAGGDSQKSGGHLRAVRQYDGDPVATADTHAVQDGKVGLDQGLQLCIAHR